MTLNLTGKGIFLWIADRALPPATCLARLREASITHVIFKIADGTRPFGTPNTPSLISYLNTHAPDITLLGYQYLYGTVYRNKTTGKYTQDLSLPSPAAEARYIADLLTQEPYSRLAGLVLDAEMEYEHFSPASRAQSYFNALNFALPNNYPVIYSTFRYPSVHPDFPWAVFASYCDITMPQVYWMQSLTATAGAVQLDRSYREYTLMYAKLNRPLVYIPTGAAFHEAGWSSTPIQVENFLTKAKTLAPAANFWEYYPAAIEKPDMWKTISTFDWNNTSTPPTPPPPPPPPLTTTYLPLQIINISAANIRFSPWGKVICTIPGKTTLLADVAASTTDSQGMIWWNIGCGFVANSVVKKLEIQL